MLRPSGVFMGEQFPLNEPGQRRPRALFLTPEPPYPLHGGGAYRSASLLHYLAGKYDVDLVGFREPGSPHPAAALPVGLAHPIGVIELTPHSRSKTARALRNLNRAVRGVAPLNDRFDRYGVQLDRLLDGRAYEVAILEHFWTAGYARVLAKHSRRIVLDLHNLESEFYGSTAKTAGMLAAPFFRRFASAAHRMEKKYLHRFDQLLAPSASDREKIGLVNPRARVVVYPNAIPMKARPQVAKENVVVFAGNLEYAPNKAGVEYFAALVWPRLRRERPELRWEVVGRNGEAVAAALRGVEGAVLVGPVDDAFPRIAKAKVAVVPVFSGSGTRVKIVEAWAAGTPVVSTPFGAAGLDAVPGEQLYVAEGVSDFFTSISNLLDSSDKQRQLAEAGRRFYEQRYTWEAAWRCLSITVL